MLIRKSTIERIRITHTYDELEEAFEYCANRGYMVIRSGPISLEKPSKFEIIADKVTDFEVVR